ncbi:hypothetical protein C4D60_Mb08t00900 [Musa balbisiana]|uniref:Uncharacterized protein n=1 Tax=Musa balbisiana TaxID=52838 RepID=A0A4S8K0J0_MUSBA|nr:hypothetical protein C4D60_Mb08t00900 [Musa balbisiana]
MIRRDRKPCNPRSTSSITTFSTITTTISRSSYSVRAVATAVTTTAISSPDSLHPIPTSLLPAITPLFPTSPVPASPRSQEQEWNENQVPEGEEDVFVLTDEWMEFFAKSEAKRKLAKQQKKKGRK